MAGPFALWATCLATPTMACLLPLPLALLAAAGVDVDVARGVSARRIDGVAFARPFEEAGRLLASDRLVARDVPAVADFVRLLVAGRLAAALVRFAPVLLALL